MTKVLVIDTKTQKERLVSRRDANLFAKLYPRGRYLTRDLVALSADAPSEPAAVADAPLPVAPPVAPPAPAPAKKSPGRPKKTAAE